MVSQERLPRKQYELIDKARELHSKMLPKLPLFPPGAFSFQGISLLIFNQHRLARNKREVDQTLKDELERLMF